METGEVSKQENLDVMFSFIKDNLDDTQILFVVKQVILYVYTELGLQLTIIPLYINLSLFVNWLII